MRISLCHGAIGAWRDKNQQQSLSVLKGKRCEMEHLLQLNTQTISTASDGHRHPPIEHSLAGSGRNSMGFCLKNFNTCLTDIYSSAQSCLERKPTHQPNLCLSWGLLIPPEAGLVFPGNGEPRPGLDLMPLSSTSHLNWSFWSQAHPSSDQLGDSLSL